MNLSGPTRFNNILEEAMRIVADTQIGTVYHVLLVITDGAIKDMDLTI
jgi:hypothetical protein